MSGGKVKDESSSSDSDSDSDFDDEPVSKLKATKKSPAKKVTRTKGKNGAKKKTTTKVKVKVKPDPVKSSTPTKKKRARPKTEAVPDDVKSSSPKRSKTSNGKAAPKLRELKKMDKAQRLYQGMQAFLWWEAQEPPEGCQWRTMEHNGVAFPDPYVPHNIQMKYNGKDVKLTPAQEEAATFFAAMDPEGMHLGNPKTAPIFEKNFFKDFRSILGKQHVIKDFKKCDFTPIRKYLEEQKIIKKAITDEQRQINKEERNLTIFKYGYAIVDNHIEKVGNYNMEPPGAFRGRGEHPKMGQLKQRVNPEQVSLNLSECARVPPCSVPGHAWGELKHDPVVQWLGQWKENINNQTKYMQLAAQSSFKGKSDRSKYNKAALLCENIDKIRADYKKNLKGKNSETKQLATAMWVIDRLALRVGGEKDTDEEADTVGCCSLRVEHLHFDPNNEGDDNMEIELEFLGKDSMLFKQTIDFGSPVSISF